MINLNTDFRWNNRNRIPQNVQRAQKYLDSQVLKDTDKYVPMRTGILVKSGILGTRIGSGEVDYIAPYAKKMYYGVTIRFNKSRHPLACAKWFEASKAVNKRSWLAEVRRIAGGR
ncbi:MAG: minor capsid protein [Oscillospiraceae bacterium]|nr:minor capsid protein [Oscillospiraceae bacterium]